MLHTIGVITCFLLTAGAPLPRLPAPQLSRAARYVMLVVPVVLADVACLRTVDERTLINLMLYKG
jgi:hypothetical protein